MLLPMPMTIVVEVWVSLCECSSVLVILLAVIYGLTSTDINSYIQTMEKSRHRDRKADE